MNIFKYLILSLLVYLTSGCGGAGAPSQSGGGGTGAKEDATVVSFQITPAVTRTPVGLTRQFIAQLNMSDGTVIDVTNDANALVAYLISADCPSERQNPSGKPLPSVTK